MHQAEVIQQVPGIETKSYLELGVWTVLGRGAMRRVGVDVQPRQSYQDDTVEFHQMTTDEYFAGPGRGELFDVVFIDADHKYESVYRDYNNVCDILAPGGLVLLHDLVPPDEEHLSPARCDDAFKMLLSLLALRPFDDILTMDTNMGLTAVRGARRLPEVPACGQKTYADLLCALADVDLLSGNELVARMRGWFEC